MSATTKGHDRFLQRRSLADARALLLGDVRAVGHETIAVCDAAGRIAAETVLARHPAPHYRASAMDGLAVRAADTAAAPLLLRALAPGENPGAEPCCLPVDTGSALPDWADAVVRIEDAKADGDGFRISAAVAPGRDVRRAGEDIDAGSLVVAEGSTLRPWDLAALLATGTTTIAVRRRPRIAILATGSEVVEPGTGAAAGQVIESNSRMLAALVEEWGGSAHRLGIVADEEAAVVAALADAAQRFDAVAVIAGSSAGRRDFTVAALETGGELLAHGLDLAPGRPAALARLRRSAGAGKHDDAASPDATPAIALPGYPVAAFVVADVLLRPLVAALLGAAEPTRERVRARLLRKIASRLGVEEFRRVVLLRQADGSRAVAALPSGAGSLSTLAGAHGWLRIDAVTEGLDADSDAEVELFVPLMEADAAFVLAGRPTPASAELEALLRRRDPRGRVLHLGRGAIDALDAVERGEAHGAVLADGPGAAQDGDALPEAFAATLAVRLVAGTRIAVVAGSPGDVVLGLLPPLGLLPK